MLLLASKSPRRHELLKMLEIPFKIVTVKDVEETFPSSLPPEEVPGYLSKLKAKAYMPNLNSEDILLTADTIVLLDNEILGKPTSLEDAKNMLCKLSGRKHKVITGVTISNKAKSVTFSSVTDVYFSILTNEAIDFYVDNFQPMDKAGAYGIQEWIGAIGIQRIDGSFYNVMGLPIHRLYKELLLF